MRTWILVADGACARFLTFAEGRKAATAMPEREMRSHAPPTRDLGRSKPARAIESVGSAKHGIEPRYDLHEQQEADFLKQVMQKVEEALDKSEFDRLVMIAPPKALGILRSLASAKLKEHKILDIHHDLTRHSEAEIAESVMKHLGYPTD